MYMLGDSFTKRVSSRLIRLLARLQEFNFEIRYLPGGKNVCADCLSRIPLPCVEKSVDSKNDLECVFSIDVLQNYKITQ